VAACARCSGPLRTDESAFGDLCLRCAWGIAAGEETPEIPGLRVLGLVGRGAMGRVYRARQLALDRDVALKILAPSLAADAEFLRRFEREGRAMARLSHPGIVGVYETGVRDDTPYLVLEYVDGAALRTIMNGQPLRPDRVRDIATRLCGALAAAHRAGLVHRDLKPENVLLTPDGTVKLADFGLALPAEEQARLTRSDVRVGTPAYMAPEQLEARGDVDARADLYAMGVMLYEMLTGRLPVGRFEKPSAHMPEAAPFDDLVLRLLERDPARRLATAEEASVALRGGRPRRRRRLALAAAGLAAVAFAAIVWAWPRAPRWETLGEWPGEYPTVVAGPPGRLLVAWRRPGHEGGIMLRQWNGRAWQEFGGTASLSTDDRSVG
jgi:hypothetical protein